MPRAKEIFQRAVGWPALMQELLYLSFGNDFDGY
jgi:hypothetical protein